MDPELPKEIISETWTAVAYKNIFQMKPLEPTQHIFYILHNYKGTYELSHDESNGLLLGPQNNETWKEKDPVGNCLSGTRIRKYPFYSPPLSGRMRAFWTIEQWDEIFNCSMCWIYAFVDGTGGKTTRHFIEVLVWFFSPNANKGEFISHEYLTYRLLNR